MIFVRQLELPMAIRGYTTPDRDGNYNVYINRDLCDEAKKQTFEHELQHIEKGHFYGEASVFELEKDVDE